MTEDLQEKKEKKNEVRGRQDGQVSEWEREGSEEESRWVNKTKKKKRQTIEENIKRDWPEEW